MVAEGCGAYFLFDLRRKLQHESCAAKQVDLKLLASLKLPPHRRYEAR